MYYEKRGRGSRNFGSGSFPPKPVEIGKEYDVEILETSRRGEGIARIKGLVCFVPNTKPGDHVRIRITRISRRFAEAEAIGEVAEEPAEVEEEKPTVAEEPAEVEEEKPTVAEEPAEVEEEKPAEADASSAVEPELVEDEK